MTQLQGGEGPTAPGLVQMLTARMGKRLSVKLEEVGLDGVRPIQAVALAPLVAGGLHATALAQRLGVSRQAVAQMIRGLERRGYVIRVPDPVDARAKIIDLTPRGHRVIHVIRCGAMELQEEWRSRLGDERFVELQETLKTLILDENGASGEPAGPSGSLDLK